MHVNSDGTLKFEPLTCNVGAVAHGIRVGEDLSDKEISSIRHAILKHKVIFIRGQNLSYRSQVKFARRFGKLTSGHPIFQSPSDQPFLREFDSKSGIRANHWHTDLTFLERPPAIAFLHSIIAPNVGGDTIWANSASAYLDVPASLRALFETLRIVHSNDCDYIYDTMKNGRLEYIVNVHETEHSAVQIHPESNECILVVGGFAKQVAGFDSRASHDLIRLMQDYITRPEHTVRWRWEKGDLAIWDNLATQHYAVYDYGNERRRNERITVQGLVPVGIDGKHSLVIRDSSSQYDNYDGSIIK